MGHHWNTSPRFAAFRSSNASLQKSRMPLVNSYDGGDHTIFVGEVERTTINDGGPLLHWQANYRKIN